MQWKLISIQLAALLPLLGGLVLLLIAALAVWRRKHAQSLAASSYREAMANNLHEPLSLHPHIDPAKCAGCGACVRACPEGDVLRIINHKAVLVHATKCVGHGQCEMACPFGAIDLVFGTKTRGMELPRITSDFETNVPGLYIAGELGGMGLIRNAVKQGRLAVEHALQHLPRAKADIDVLIVGAGAAGLSAALAAIAAKRSYLCIEQHSVGGTIYNFPRQKIVMTQPAELPLVGTMRFAGNKVSKEELLRFWSGVRRATRLKVLEGCKFLNLAKEGEIFKVETSRGPMTARKVILAMGVRGTPRKLGVPGEDSAKVTYNLLEPEQYQGMDVAVVGGGNAAVEAAQYLARPQYGNRVTLLVRGPRFDRCNQENQALIYAMAKRGELCISFDSTVQEIHADHLVVGKNQKKHILPNHYLFIFAGAELPFKFLQGLGVGIDKKFDESLRKTQ